MTIKKLWLMTVEMPDGSKWGVPVDMIAINRATHYASEFDGDVSRSLAEDTTPLFLEDEYAIEDWAVNNMNWSDFRGHHYKVAESPGQDFERAWLQGDKSFCTLEVAHGITGKGGEA